MIHIDKDLNNKPLSLRDTIFFNSLQQIIRDGNGKNIDEDIYKGKNYLIYDHTNNKMFGDVQKALKDLYHNKCAYCEKITTEPDIEHYRPKNEVMIPNISRRGSWTKLSGHNGYYWLAYEWSNLIPSCDKCNRFGGKSTRFPILDESRRISIPIIVNDLPTNIDAIYLNQIELPYLLHPEIDEPKNYFKFDIFGQIAGTDNEGRGEMTIKICNLRHTDLNLWRKEVILEFNQAFLDVWEIYYISNKDENLLSLLVNQIFQKFINHIQNPAKEYRLLAWYIYQNFKTIFAPPILPSEICPKLHEIYENFYRQHIL
jgi:uncharacterized protein (TIGR02646 family)